MVQASSTYRTLIEYCLEAPKLQVVFSETPFGKVQETKRIALDKLEG